MTLPRVSDWLLRRYKWKSFGQDAFIKTTLRHIILVLTWNFVTVNISQRTDPLLHGSRIGTRVTALVLCVSAGTWLPALGNWLARKLSSDWLANPYLKEEESSCWTSPELKVKASFSYHYFSRACFNHNIILRVCIVYSGCIVAPMAAATWLLSDAVTVHGEFSIVLAVVMLTTMVSRYLKQEFQEFSEICGRQRVLAKIFQEHFCTDMPWNLIDTVTILTCATVVIRVVFEMERDDTLRISVFGTLFLWFRMIDCLSGFEETVSTAACVFSVPWTAACVSLIPHGVRLSGGLRSHDHADY